MKIVIDNKIPYIQEKLQHLADQVVALGGAEIGPDDVRDADALIVRTRTRCDELLLKGSSVQFYFLILVGYLFGITSKAIKLSRGVSTLAIECPLCYS